MRFFCTLFDKNYLPNFLALHDSIEKHIPEFTIYAFCMDEFSVEYLQLPSTKSSIKAIGVNELLNYYPQLVPIKNGRSFVEFYFTCSPFICNYVFENEANCSQVTYLDADLYFFNSPEYVFQEISDSSIAIIPHHFYGIGKRYEKYGIYNVGWVSFQNNEIGRACLQSWLLKCAEWCFDYYDKVNERFGDQKYLDAWQEKFKDVKIVQQKGANLAPWNVGQYQITQKENRVIYIDEDLLVFYHFASFKKLNSDVYTTSISRYFARPNNIIKEKIYSHYLQEVYRNSLVINASSVGESSQLMKKNRMQVHRTSFNKLLTDTLINLRRWYFNDYVYLKTDLKIK